MPIHADSDDLVTLQDMILFRRSLAQKIRDNPSRTLDILINGLTYEDTEISAAYAYVCHEAFDLLRYRNGHIDDRTMNNIAFKNYILNGWDLGELIIEHGGEHLEESLVPYLAYQSL